MTKPGPRLSVASCAFAFSSIVLPSDEKRRLILLLLLLPRSSPWAKLLVDSDDTLLDACAFLPPGDIDDAYDDDA